MEFTETPEVRPYGIDCGFRDPSGNSVRLTQVAEMTQAWVLRPAACGLGSGEVGGDEGCEVMQVTGDPISSGKPRL